MLKVKRRARGSDERRKVRKRGVNEVSDILSDLGDGGMTESLGHELTEKLSPSIISLASFIGKKLYCKSTGIVIEEHPFGPCILTSLRLIAKTPDEFFNPPVKIMLRLPNNQLVCGTLKGWDLNYSMAVITTGFSPDVRAACLNDSLRVEPNTKLLAVKRCFSSGNLMASSGVLIDRPSRFESESSCKVSMDGICSPVVDFEGNIIGMNEYPGGSGITRHIPANEMLKFLESIGFSRNLDEVRSRLLQVTSGDSTTGNDEEKDLDEPQVTSGDSTTGNGEEKELDEPQVTSGDSTTRNDEEKDLDEPQVPECTCTKDTPEDECDLLGILRHWPRDDFTAVVNESLESDGYPVPKYDDGGMHLEGHLEEEFSIDNWRKKTRRRISLKTCRSVVALASFNEKGRYSACSGVLIDSIDDSNQSIRVLTSANLVRNGDTIDENLRIKVYLPNKELTPGTLQHYSLHYNVAVVSIEAFDGNRAAKFVEEPQTNVVALGRVYKSGNFMATRGVVTGRQSRFDCKELKVSSCKITKAGIGGPLVDFNGNIVGMNFYDREETPYLPSDVIQKLLRQFDREGTVAADITEQEHCNRWPVPSPYWYYPTLHRLRNYEPEFLLENLVV